MDIGSDVGTPLTGTQISIWPLPEKAKGHSPGALCPPPEARPLQQGKLTIGTGSAKISFDDLYQQYYPRVLAYLRFRTGTLDVAEDLVSLVFERALSHLADLQTSGAAGAWLFRIARNCVSDYFRRHQFDLSLDTLVDGNHPCERSAEEVIVAREERKLLLTHLNHLSEREREVIGLKFVACLQNREIARVLHMPEGTVSSLLHRALARLREALDIEGGNNR
jgi:RNA polymerase sigma-70 factor, ECF subfamily